VEQKTAGLKTKAMQVVEQQIGEPIEDYLRRRYEGDRWTTDEIARELGLNNGTVSRWMAHFGIAARLIGPRRVAI
jgi:transcriptional regulator of acetoin/glycerol metabolism